MHDIASAVDRIYCEEAGRLHAYLLSKVGNDFQLAEDALHDAVTKAIEVWSTHGIPEHPAGWLAITARNRAVNELRRRVRHSKKANDLKLLVQLDVEEHYPSDPPTFPDERLRLIFTCCHPSLSLEAQIGLTLRTVCGLGTEQISAAFLIPVSTLAQRLVRAKRKIKQAGIPYVVPEGKQLTERLPSVLRVLYLVFNAGYEAERFLVSKDICLCDEGINLARMLDSLLPNTPEVIGLLALMLLHASRREARVDKQGRLVTLENQDRQLWDKGFIHEGNVLVEKALTMGRVGEYQLHAAIAALHSQADCPEKTDWPQIVALYKLLLRINPSPTIKLNHAAAVGMADSPEDGLKLLDEIKSSEALKAYHLLFSAYADLQRRLDRFEESLENYKLAMKLTDKPLEKKYYMSRIEELSTRAASTGSSLSRGI